MFDVDLRSTEKPYGHQSMCLFFGHQDASHFYYVHFGREADAHANSIFKVDGEPRVSIAKTRTEGTDWSSGWHRARIVREVASGKIEVYFDDMETPVMTTVDKSFLSGRVGIGSFDDTGDFDSVRLWGKLARREVAASAPPCFPLLRGALDLRTQEDRSSRMPKPSPSGSRSRAAQNPALQNALGKMHLE